MVGNFISRRGRRSSGAMIEWTFQCLEVGAEGLMVSDDFGLGGGSRAAIKHPYSPPYQLGYHCRWLEDGVALEEANLSGKVPAPKRSLLKVTGLCCLVLEWGNLSRPSSRYEFSIDLIYSTVTFEMLEMYKIG